jgi:hypothetical protein
MSEHTPSPKELAQERLRARAARIARLRRRVTAAALATFVIAFGTIAYTGSMGATTPASTTTQTTASVSSSSSSSESTSDDSTFDDSSSSSSSSDDSSTSSGTPSAVTTSQS